LCCFNQNLVRIIKKFLIKNKKYFRNSHINKIMVIHTNIFLNVTSCTDNVYIASDCTRGGNSTRQDIRTRTYQRICENEEWCKMENARIASSFQFPFSFSASSSRAEQKASSWIAAEAEVETRTRALTRDVTDINREFSINSLPTRQLSRDRARRKRRDGFKRSPWQLSIRPRESCRFFCSSDQVSGLFQT